MLYEQFPNTMPVYWYQSMRYIMHYTHTKL